MKKQLIIISSTTAREINPLGEKPVDIYVDSDSDTGPFYNSKYLKWKAAEDVLKEYTIPSRIVDGKYLTVIQGLIVIEVPVGETRLCEVNEETKTCVIL